MSDEVNFADIPAKGPTQDAAWNLHAVKLAVEKHLAGRAKFIRYTHEFDYATRSAVNARNYYTCTSQSEPIDHELVFELDDGTVHCDCKSGEHNKPCAHAGAVLLLQCRLAPDNAIVDPSERG